MKLFQIVGETFLWDAVTGKLIQDQDGNRDMPEQYEVLRRLPNGGYAVRGPSGQVDHTDPNDPTRLYRDAEHDPHQYGHYPEENF